MTSFNRLLTEDLRFVILQLLSQAPGYDLNHYILSSALDELGHQPSMDKLRSELTWLEEQALVSLRHVGSTVIAKITARGNDVQAGRASIPGVNRPSPG